MDKVFEYLTDRPDGASAEEIAREALGLRGAVSVVATRVVRAAAETDSRIVEGHGGQWLDWFDEHRIAGVGMGMITVRAPRHGERRAPDQVLEEITGAGEALTGPEVAAFFARREYLHDTTDEQLLAARLSTAPVFLEEQSLPGPDGWPAKWATAMRAGVLPPPKNKKKDGKPSLCPKVCEPLDR